MTDSPVVKRARTSADSEPNRIIILTILRQCDNDACTVVVERDENWFPEQFELAWSAPADDYAICQTEDLPDQLPLWNALCALFLGVEVPGSSRSKFYSKIDLVDRVLRHEYISKRLAKKKTLEMWVRDQKMLSANNVWPSGKPRAFFVLFM